MARLGHALASVAAGMLVVLGGAALVGPPTAAAGAAAASDPTSPPTVAATEWTNAEAASASSTVDNQLNGVSCTSESFCAAVGGQNLGVAGVNNGEGGGTLTELWDGGQWTIVPSPDAPGTTENSLTAVSCVGSSFCLAVGGNETGPTALWWNGAGWNVVAVALPAGGAGGTLTSVSCVSATTCELLGRTVVGGVITLYGNQWDGSTLSVTSAVTPPGSHVLSASGISCVTTIWCLAVGSTNVQDPATATPFSEMWDGNTWQAVTTPAAGDGAPGSSLRAVSCAGVAFCAAVGLAAGTTVQNFAESWNGSGWSISPTPDTSSTLAQELTGVSCFSPTTCTAVGQTQAASGPSPATLALNWNGTSWTVAAATPNADGSFTALTGVSCVTNWSCMAAGYFQSQTSPDALEPFVMTALIARSGYRFVAADGGVFSYGAGAPFLGSMGGTRLNEPIVGLAVMPGSDGYDLVAADGGVFSFGSAQFYGSTGSLRLNAPVVGMALTADGAGYWLVASDGGVFSYGDAQFYGSAGGLTLHRPIVGMAATPDGRGYWLVASDGGIFSYGDAGFHGSMGGMALNEPVVGMAADSSGAYYLVASDGGVFNFPGCPIPACSFPASPTGPTAEFLGSAGSLRLNKPIVGISAPGAGYTSGYYLAGSDGGIYSYGDALFYGSTGSIRLNAPIVGIAS